MSFKTRISSGIGLQLPISRKAFGDDYAMGFQQHLMGATLTITGVPDLTKVPFNLRAPGQVVFSKNDGSGKPAIFILDVTEDVTDSELQTDDYWTKYSLGSSPIGGGLQQPGTWDATANNAPQLTDGVTPDPQSSDPLVPKTNIYIVQVAGTVQHDGVTDTVYAVGDTAIYTEEDVWAKLETSANAASGPVAWSNITNKPVLFGDGSGGTRYPNIAEVAGLDAVLNDKLSKSAKSTPQPGLDLATDDVAKALRLGDSVSQQGYYDKLVAYQHILRLFVKYDAWLRGASGTFADADAANPTNTDYFKGSLREIAQKTASIIDDTVTGTAASADKRTWSIQKIYQEINNMSLALSDLTDVATGGVQEGMTVIRQGTSYILGFIDHNLQRNILGDGLNHVDDEQLEYLRSAVYKPATLSIDPNGRVGSTYYRSGESLNYTHDIQITIANVANVNNNVITINAVDYDADVKNGTLHTLTGVHTFTGSETRTIGDFMLHDQKTGKQERHTVKIQSRLEVLYFTWPKDESPMDQAIFDGIPVSDIKKAFEFSAVGGDFTFEKAAIIPVGGKFYSYMLIDEDLNQANMTDVRDHEALNFPNSFAMDDVGTVIWNNGFENRTLRVFRSENASSSTATIRI